MVCFVGVVEEGLGGKGKKKDKALIWYFVQVIFRVLSGQVIISIVWGRKLWKTTHFHENPQNIPSHVFDKKVYRLMGYDSEKREIKMGMLAEKTHPYIRDKVMIVMIQILTDFS